MVLQRCKKADIIAITGAAQLKYIYFYSIVRKTKRDEKSDKKREILHMKMKKVVALGFVGVLACSSLTACGNKVTLPKEPAKIAAAADKETAKADNFEGKGTMTVAGKVMGQDVTFDADMTMTYFKDPMKLKVDVNYKIQDDKDMSASVYFMQENNNYVVYVGSDDEWQKSTLDKNDENDKKAVELLDRLQKADSKKNTESAYKGKIEKAKEKEKDGTTVLEYKMTGDRIQKIIEESGALKQASSMGISKDMFSDLKDLNATLVVDNDTVRWKSMEMDCTEFTQCIVDKVMDTVKTLYGSYLDKSTDLTAKFDKVSIKVTLDNYNKAKDFKLPDKAKNAKEADSDSLLNEAK